MTLCIPPPATSNLKYYCCFGRIHVKKALLMITCVLVFAESLEMVMYVTGRYALKTATHYFFDIFEAISIVGLVAALRTEQPAFLWPFLITQFLVLISLLLLTIISYVVVVFPSSDYWSLFVTAEEENGPKINVRLRALVAWILYVIGDAYEIWTISVALACHRYYDDINEVKEERLRKSRNRISQPTVNPKVQQSDAQISSKEEVRVNNSFTNPAFVIDDSDDENILPPFEPDYTKRQIA